MKRSNENENDFRSKNNKKKRKIIDKEELIEKFLCSNFYIDKTLLIKDFIEEKSSIIRVIAPSGYGKTVNLNMLRYFFEMNYKDENNNENKKFFEKLNIAKETKDGESYIDLYQGKFPVIYINFDDIYLGNSFDETIKNFKYFIQDLYIYYKSIKNENLSKYEKKMIKKFKNCEANFDDLKDSIYILCNCLYNTFKKKIILLIDNYDSPILNSLNTNFFDDLYSFHQELLTNIFEYERYIFKSFITDMDYLLQNGFIEKSIPKLSNFKMLKKEYINNRDIIWTLLIKYGYLIIADNDNIISNNNKLKIRNKEIKEFIEKSIYYLKDDLYNNSKYSEIIDLFIKNYDEEKIQEFLENSINKVNYSRNENLNKWYALIYSLLSLNNEYVIVTKNKYDEKDNIRELLYVHKDYLDRLNNNCDNNNNSNSNNSNESNKKNDQFNPDLSEIFYITINIVTEEDKIKEGCIQALDDNEEFLFNGKELKNIYNKIIKFGISVCGKKCGVIYEINYGNKFKRKEMATKVYSGENYDDLYEEGYYFIDKTRMINKLIEKGNAVYLITRPRRFGKSLNLKMIQKFFEKRTKGDSKGNDVFDGLEVSKDRKNMRECHKYPVIYLNFKDNESKTYESAIMYLKSKISSQFKYQREKIDFKKLDTSDQKLWNKIENEEEDMNKLNESIHFLCQCLIEKKFYKRKCIVLIDEYDKILINSFENGYYEMFIGIVRSFFSNIFKGNEYLYFGIITGCLGLELKTFYSGLNNIHEHTLLSDHLFYDCYGFTESELKKNLSHFEIPLEEENKIQKEYNGYSCGYGNRMIKNLYNPYSIMKFISNNKNKKDDHLFKNYWFNSESDTVLNKIIKENEFSFKKDFLSLLYGNVIIVEIKEILTLKKNYLKDEVWTVLLHSGYITLSDKEGYKQNIKEMDDQIIKLLLGESKLNENDVNEDLIKKYKNNQLNKHLYNNMYYIKIPNNEIFNCFIAKLKESLKNEIKDNNYLNNFINGLFNKDIDTINSNLNDYLTCLSQYHLFANEKDYENVYQVLLMQIFIFCKIYGLSAEENSGSGRYDFGFPNRNKEKEYILIEVKTCKSENCDDNLLHKECENAINQIIEKKYKMKHEKNGYSSFIIYGITFWKKTCRIEMRINNNDIKVPSESLKE
ncbi:DUF1703-domain-containing protein [Neocallimastix californiae]|uniref:DUF1703-domain-containing protein n=1 Tax=Neocallimastix californiae TaxID=1754190 RepID=A0A1Y1YT47_9FUNG|nr:DUF1703-domain-containing protein [Neocallimastix californiae]|eukprot:ORY01208.1 DUF1703-domain-containing protein [Neocallimastix californiae]